MPDDLIKKYYVYELRDPRDNDVFYVGKGQRERYLGHSAEDIDENDQRSAKSDRIDAINQAGYEDAFRRFRIIIGQYETEAEALAVEATLIKWVYGIDNLTNQINGHRHNFVRPFHQTKNFRLNDPSPYEPISGVDRERDVGRINTGEYTEEQLRKIKENRVEEKLEALYEDLVPRAKTIGATVSEPDLSKPQDPHLAISIEGEVVLVRTKLQITGRKVVICLTHVPGRENAVNFSRFVENKKRDNELNQDEKIKAPNADRRWFWFDSDGKNGFSIDNYNAIWDSVRNGLSIIKEDVKNIY